jgi:hypothetical protein
MSAWVTFRDWFVSKILPLVIGIVADLIKRQASVIPGLMDLIGLVQPYIQAAYDKAVTEQDLKMQAILLVILSRLFLMQLTVPGVEVLSPEEAGGLLQDMAKESMDALPEAEKSWWLKLWTAWMAQEAPEPPPPPEGN